jgi:hypothetical protein
LDHFIGGLLASCGFGVDRLADSLAAFDTRSHRGHRNGSDARPGEGDPVSAGPAARIWAPLGFGATTAPITCRIANLRMSRFMSFDWRTDLMNHLAIHLPHEIP